MGYRAILDDRRQHDVVVHPHAAGQDLGAKDQHRPAHAEGLRTAGADALGRVVRVSRFPRSERRCISAGRTDRVVGDDVVGDAGDRHRGGRDHRPERVAHVLPALHQLEHALLR
ncbi:hypothetical protein D3C81_1784890 [compost metagenome]